MRGTKDHRGCSLFCRERHHKTVACSLECQAFACWGRGLARWLRALQDRVRVWVSISISIPVTIAAELSPDLTELGSCSTHPSSKVVVFDTCP